MIYLSLLVVGCIVNIVLNKKKLFFTVIVGALFEIIEGCLAGLAGSASSGLAVPVLLVSVFFVFDSDLL